MRVFAGLLVAGFAYGVPEPVYEWPDTKGYEINLRTGVRFYEKSFVYGIEPYVFLDYRISYPFLIGAGGGIFIGSSVIGYSFEGRIKTRIPIVGRWKLDPGISVLYSRLEKGNRKREKAGGGLTLEVFRFTSDEAFFGFYAGYMLHAEQDYNFWRLGIVGGF